MKSLLTERDSSELVQLPVKALRLLRTHGFGPSWVKLTGGVRYDAASAKYYVAQGDETFNLPNLSQ
jgi:hypothetical protein